MQQMNERQRHIRQAQHYAHVLLEWQRAVCLAAHRWDFETGGWEGRGQKRFDEATEKSDDKIMDMLFSNPHKPKKAPLSSLQKHCIGLIKYKRERKQEKKEQKNVNN